jgi:hypothetical protein
MIRSRVLYACPPWCAGGHRCTARFGYPRGEHRSRPVTVRTGYGVVVCTRVQNVDGRGRLEIRLEVDLPSEESLAEVRAVQVANGVDRAVRYALATGDRPPAR